MSLKYVFQSDASQLRRDPLASGETVYEGEFVVRESGEIARFDPANDSTPDGIIVHHEGRLSDALVEHDEDYVDYENLYQFDAANGDNPYYLPLKAGQSIQPQSVQESNVDTEPDFDDGDEVGIVTIGSETRIVPAGYTQSGTQYGNGGGGDYVALGEVYQPLQFKRFDDQYDQRIPVYLKPSIFPA